MLKNRTDTICYSCHFDAEVKFLKTNTHIPVVDGKCNTCHRSHGAANKNLLAADRDDPKLCVGCHADLMKPAEGGSNHEFFKNGRCLKCHEVHGGNIAGMIVSKQGFLCYSCHGTDPGKEVKNIKSSHDPVVEGECTKCHSPHKANLDDLLLADYPDLCLTCHTDLKARMYPKTNNDTQGNDTQSSNAKTGEAAAAKIYVHAPSDLKNCQICHKPHFSAELDLIVKPIQPLCGKCHDYKTTSFREAHLNIDAGVMDCRKCHDSHTSTDPKFFKATMHKPFKDRTCKDCHII